MEKSELLTKLRETLKSNPEFKEKVLEEIESIESGSIDREIDNWVDRTKPKNY
jgi:hypothetical protein